MRELSLVQADMLIKAVRSIIDFDPFDAEGARRYFAYLARLLELLNRLDEEYFREKKLNRDWLLDRELRLGTEKLAWMLGAWRKEELSFDFEYPTSDPDMLALFQQAYRHWQTYFQPTSPLPPLDATIETKADLDQAIEGAFQAILKYSGGFRNAEKLLGFEAWMKLSLEMLAYLKEVRQVRHITGTYSHLQWPLREILNDFLSTDIRLKLFKNKSGNEEEEGKRALRGLLLACENAWQEIKIKDSDIFSEASTMPELSFDEFERRLNCSNALLLWTWRPVPADEAHKYFRVLHELIHLIRGDLWELPESLLAGLETFTRIFFWESSQTSTPIFFHVPRDGKAYVYEKLAAAFVEWRPVLEEIGEPYPEAFRQIEAHNLTIQEPLVPYYVILNLLRVRFKNWADWSQKNHPLSDLTDWVILTAKALTYLQQTCQFGRPLEVGEELRQVISRASCQWMRESLWIKL